MRKLLIIAAIVLVIVLAAVAYNAAISEDETLAQTTEEGTGIGYDEAYTAIYADALPKGSVPPFDGAPLSIVLEVK